MNDAQTARYVVMMVKQPVGGRVKSRLAADIGFTAATSIYRTMMFNTIRRLCRDTRWRFVLSVSPDGAIHEPIWPQNIPVIAQGGGGLGARMQRVMAQMPPGQTIIIGSDIAGMKPVHIADAFKKLGNADAVFSPADDGGYSLVGLKRTPRILNIFENVRWSSEHTLHDTLKNLADHKVAYIDELPDIDTGTDWQNWQATGKAGKLCL